ncbi:hypothetical protein BDQ12DRAFT_724351 [Crucibulum laeve]|uniref:Uncharacterized protein n=1 Tax=Crucibulum laeve TaxID=68775 RepID=A0A5C3LZ77_9AGAR|nr:hypothetical protein BDQ12DRAFT_724351 [Crucibulum laeve]
MVLITCDNYYTLYVNGIIVDAVYNSNDVFWQTSFLYNIKIYPTPSAVFSVRGFNIAKSSAALIAAIKITHTDGTASIITTGSKGWTGSKIVTDGWERLTNDSWDPVQTIAPYSQGPWGTTISLATALAPNSQANSMFPPFTGLTETNTGPGSSPQSPLTNSSIPSSGSKLGRGVIVGIALAGAATVAMFASLAYFLRRKVLRNKDDSDLETLVRKSPPLLTPFSSEMQQQPLNPGFITPDPTYQSHPQQSSSTTINVESGSVFHAHASTGEPSPPAYESHTQQSGSVIPGVGYVSGSQADPFSDPKLQIPHVLAYNPRS